MMIPPSIYSTSLEDYEAIQLFLYHARRIQPNFELVKEHASVVRICNLTEGLPLAIELANQYTEQSLRLARISYNRVALVICLYNLGSGYILKGDYAKGKQYCLEALEVATEAGHQGQIAHALSLVALCAFCQGDYRACQEYAQRSYTIIEDINPMPNISKREKSKCPCLWIFTIMSMG
jgi:tetratricopeptide (TPR) repeat protein